MKFALFLLREARADLVGLAVGADHAEAIEIQREIEELDRAIFLVSSMPARGKLQVIDFERWRVGPGEPVRAVVAIKGPDDGASLPASLPRTPAPDSESRPA